MNCFFISLRFWLNACLPLLLLISTLAAAQSGSKETDNRISLNTIDGAVYKLEQTAAHKATVFLFLSPECPLCRSYTPTIKALAKEFSKQSIEFLSVFPGTAYSKSEIRSFLTSYGLTLPALLDPDLKLAQKLQAGITPEAVVLGNKGEVLYAGSIDNWAYAVGRKRQVITEHYLRQALSAITKGQPVKTPRTKAVGCLIE